MLSKRIVGSLIVKDGIVVQSIRFERYLPVGSPQVAIEFLNEWGVDEIVVLDITASANRRPDFALVERLAKKTAVPLTIGGGVTSLADMRALIHGGADKFVINTAASGTPMLIQEAAAVFGNQCVAVSIDVREGGDAVAIAQAQKAAELGAGELLVRRVERDGSKKGFDTELVRQVATAVPIPVIAAGGCGSASHIAEVFAAGASAAAVGNILHFTEHSVTTLKAELRAMKVPVRLDTYATYARATFESGRLAKQDEAVLEKLRFEYHPPETI